MGLFVSGGEVGKGKAGREIRIKQMSFLQPTAPEVCWSSAWKQDGAIPRKSCYCAELHLLKDLFGFFLKGEKVALSVEATTLLLLVLLLFLCIKPPNLKPRVVYTNQLFINCGSN